MFLLICRKSVQRCMRRFLRKEMQKRPPTELVTVRRWQRSAAAEGRWGSLTKFGVTESMTVRRVYDGPSCRFVMKFREVIPVPIFQELKCFVTKTLDGPLCLWRSVIPVVEGNEESSRRNCIKYGTTESMTVRRDHDDPSRVPSTQPCFDRFPAIRILV